MHGRAWASSNMANVVSLAILMEPIGSITTATFKCIPVPGGDGCN